MEWARLVKDYLDVILWPFLSVTALVGAFLWLFRAQIGSLVNRINRIDLPGGGGISAAPPHQPDEPSQAPPGGEPPAPGEPPPAEPTAIANDNRVVDEAAIKQVNESWAEVVRWYEYYYFYERTYRLIYGSQIALLEHLKALGPGGGNESALLIYHSSHLQQARAFDPSYNYPWESFIGYLIVSNLVQRQTQLPLYHITDLGLSFLAWGLAEKVPPKAL